VAVLVFNNDESGYLSWVTRNVGGFVVNTRNVLDPQYLVLHRASCTAVLHHRNMERNPGGFTERGYQKICSLSADELHAYLQGITGTQTSFSKFCSKCQPAFP